MDPVSQWILNIKYESPSIKKVLRAVPKPTAGGTRSAISRASKNTENFDTWKQFHTSEQQYSAHWVSGIIDTKGWS